MKNEIIAGISIVTISVLLVLSIIVSLNKTQSVDLEIKKWETACEQRGGVPDLLIGCVATTSLIKI